MTDDWTKKDIKRGYRFRQPGERIPPPAGPLGNINPNEPFGSEHNPGPVRY